MSQLRSGVGVNIVLKADQPTGRLTSGLIADILTKGDHPRGIKVRLTSGKIGRVQSLSPAGDGTNANLEETQSSRTPHGRQYRQPLDHGHAAGQLKGRFGIQQDYRSDPVPKESISLEDYIKPSRQKNKRGNAAVSGMEQTSTDAQAQLEVDFPNIDSALIAAILIDHPTLQEAKNILGALS